MPLVVFNSRLERTNMTWEDALRVIGSSLFSVLSAGAIIMGLASWLGKVWAERVLRNESHDLQEKLRDAQHRLDVSLRVTERELDLIKEAHASVRNDKVAIYRGVVDLIATLLAKLDAHEMNRLPPDEAVKHFDSFNEQRIRLYGYMAMFAPQSVMDAQDQLIDYLLQVSHGVESYQWETVRKKALALINEVRRDVGIDKSPIANNGCL